MTNFYEVVFSGQKPELQISFEVLLTNHRFTEHWINVNFSGNHGSEAARLYEIFAQVTHVRKIEHMNSNVFSQTANGDEAGRRLILFEGVAFAIKTIHGENWLVL
ncbi:hypothetical protein [Paenibacillus roseipurpureus]|uniref:Uncharacterized protein n=1 Tax=Paenibacillus roseopurpureus TaxID=2918901 RepID=A0AA96LNJ7_9BACL|nr:hypothetical protein [Paenibacillus sp. MBLB1832]WNR45287.1 hypothetical protein MJB10_03885 [Paenibacillus sp. MBLB1832]